MIIEPDDLAHVPLDTFGPSACTPRVEDPAWRGIAVRSASRIAFEEGERPVVPVCVYAMLDVPKAPIDAQWMLCAQSALGELYRGPIISQKGEPRIPAPAGPPIPPELLEGLAVAAFFNCDLMTICRIPTIVTELTVWVEHAEARSNDALVVLEQITPSS